MSYVTNVSFILHFAILRNAIELHVLLPRFLSFYDLRMRASDQAPSERQAGIWVAIGRCIPANYPYPYPLTFSKACCLVSSAIKSLGILDFFGIDDGNQGKLGQ
jgi:hypothetical protein